jgi:phytanoyl-CoA hydroxylase
MGFTHLKPAFDRDGFVVVRKFLDGDELTELRDNLDRYIHTVVPTLPASAAFYDDRGRPETLKQLQHMGCDAFFADYRGHPRWTALAEALLGESVTAKEPEWFNKPPGTMHVTPPHQDNFYFCLRPPHVVTLWLALDAIDEQNGCLRYVLGSHANGVRPHGPTAVLGFSQGVLDYGPSDAAREVAIRLEPGDLVAHHGDTIHRADANRTADRQRRAFAMVLQGDGCQRDDAAFERYQEALRQQHSGLGLASNPAM